MQKGRMGPDLLATRWDVGPKKGAGQRGRRWRKPLHHLCSFQRRLKMVQ